MPKTLLKPCARLCGTVHRVAKKTWKTEGRVIGGWFHGAVKCCPSCPSTLHSQNVWEERKEVHESSGKQTTEG